MACSLHHEGIVNREWARIRVHRRGIEHTVPIVCNQGKSCDRECVQVCPAECIRDVNGHAIEVVREECIGCGDCVEACPYDAIHMRGEVAFKCNLCDGEPTCTKFCSVLAITDEEGIGEEYENARAATEVMK
jgi:Fe-S-cluster-containing hydrogenase component 2